MPSVFFNKNLHTDNLLAKDVNPIFMDFYFYFYSFYEFLKIPLFQGVGDSANQKVPLRRSGTDASSQFSTRKFSTHIALRKKSELKEFFF